jgi:multidrug efflux system outer membrane protein
LIAANANVGVAKVNFFPTISLTGLLGGVSPQLSELTATGKAWGLAGNLAGPLFMEAARRTNIAHRLPCAIKPGSPSRKRLREPLVRFPRPLSAHQQLAEACRGQLKSVDAYRESVRLSLTRYDSGLSSYFEIVDAQIQLYPAESASVTYDSGRELALVDLYRTLGGVGISAIRSGPLVGYQVRLQLPAHSVTMLPRDERCGINPPTGAYS